MKNKAFKKVLVSIGVLLGIVIVFAAGFLIFASVTTLRVQASETVSIHGSAAKKAESGREIKMLTWNIGYGALDERQDFYYDGGTGVDGESPEVVRENLRAIKDMIKETDPDVFFLQEADIDSKRSYHIDEIAYFEAYFKGDAYQNSFARNFKAGYIPIPLNNPMGQVEAGIATFSRFNTTSATREQLPVPFSWPMSLVNLKRCLLINRCPVMFSDKELVTVNLHLEAYDDGEGKAKQLRQLMDFMQAEYDKGNYVVACGDFNQTFSNADLSRYPKIVDWDCPVIDVSQYPDFTFSMDDSVPTCRSLDKPYYNSDKSTHQYYMLDGFITSNNIRVNAIETVDLGFKNTDHNPVAVTLTLG